MIPDELHPRMVKLPVRIVDGVPQPFYGPTWPKLKDGTIAEMTIPAAAFLNPEDETLLTAPLGVVLLEKGTSLLAAVSDQATGEGIIVAGERIFAEAPFSCFVPFELVEDLRIQLRGTKRARLEPCMCRVPTLGAAFASVNETYAKISEKYEPHRRSHTGNVFEKVLYLRDLRGDRAIWSPLENLRQGLEAMLEQRFRG